MFNRNDTTCSPLQPTYDGPFEVTNKTPKFFKVLRNAKKYTASIDRLKSASLLTDLTHTHKNRMTNRLTTTGEVHTTSRSASSEQTRQPAGEDFRCTKFTQTRSRKINPPQRYTMIANKYFLHIYFLLILACVSYIFTSTLEFNFSVCSETHVKAEYALQDPTPCKTHIFLFNQIMQHKRFETRTLYL